MTQRKVGQRGIKVKDHYRKTNIVDVRNAIGLSVIALMGLSCIETCAYFCGTSKNIIRKFNIIDSREFPIAQKNHNMTNSASVWVCQILELKKPVGVELYA